MTITVEIVRDPRTAVLKAFVMQEGRRASSNLLTGHQFTNLETARRHASFELRCRYPPAGMMAGETLEISFLYQKPKEEERSAKP